MSSRRKAPPAGKAPGAPKESKAIKGPIITPQALGIVFAIAALIILGVMISNNNKANAEIASIGQQIKSEEANITTYTTKGKKKDEADKLNKALKTKLNSLDYLFLDDDSSLVPFWEQTLLPLIDQDMQPTGESKIFADTHTFQINMAMRPFDTLPTGRFFDNSADVFKIHYEPEQNGQPIETPIDTRPTKFLEPYSVRLEGFRGSYTDVKNFVKHLQMARQKDTLIVVHCLRSDESKNNVGAFQADTEWKIQLTVYFMNSERPAEGDAPPAAPGSKSC